MSPSSQWYDLIRPLLNITRQDLRDYLAACEQPWFDDPSNDNAAFDRVAMRQLRRN